MSDPVLFSRVFGFKPFVSPDQSPHELTLRSVLLGLFFGLLFGAATLYLGLKIGLTLTASIPIAVLSIAIFKQFGQSTILENNIVQTIGSAGEAVAGGVTITIPALIFLGFPLDMRMILAVSLIGGTLGILFTIPLRRFLIVKQHGRLPYPEGTACADVLIAGEKGAGFAKILYSGLGFSAFYKLLMNIFGFWKEIPNLALPWLRGAIISAEVSPELLGVGYIIGPRIAGALAGGGALAWLVLMPLIRFFGKYLSIPIAPATRLISDMNMTEIWTNYIRYIGGGALLYAACVTAIKSIAALTKTFSKQQDEELEEESSSYDELSQIRTEHDLPMLPTLLGILAVAATLFFLPFLPGSQMVHIVMAVAVVLFGFFFCSVSSQIAGFIGTGLNPISGLTLLVLMAIGLIFVLFGWGGREFSAIALTVAAIVCIALTNAANTAQNLKTGYLVGATPYKQQIGLWIGVIAASLLVSFALVGMHQASGIGSEFLPAPKGQLTALVLDGVLNQSLPWDLILFGLFLGFAFHLCGIEILPFAAGVYLPFSVSLPIFLGGGVRWLVQKKVPQERETSPGVLYSAGLIAGGSVMGIVFALLKGFEPKLFNFLNMGPQWRASHIQGSWSDAASFAMFLFMSWTLLKIARRRV